MQVTGALEDGGRSLVLTRALAHPIDDVWAAITESDQLSRWFGTWSGDPSTGSVMVTMNAEAETPPAVRYEIHECAAPQVLSISATDDFGRWVLRIDLDRAASGTVVTFRQTELDPVSLADIGAGWEWYLDRLAAALAGAAVPGLDAFETDYLAIVPVYAAMVEAAPG